MISKGELDRILISHKAQTVGGYGEIIVRQENVSQLIEELIFNDIYINRITWWEYVDSISQSSNYGHGGPKSVYFEGWFSEICFGEDEIDENNVESILKIIDGKEITFSDGEIVQCNQAKWLTPTLCIDVPENWDPSNLSR